MLRHGAMFVDDGPSLEDMAEAHNDWVFYATGEYPSATTADPWTDDGYRPF